MDHFALTRTELPAALARTIFEDRSRQFVDRLNWSLTVTPDGLELDEYDDDHSVYLVVADGMRHLGSCRVRSVRASTMLVDHFLPVFPDAVAFMRQQRGRVWELTRFCRTPDIPVDISCRMLERLAVVIDGFRDKHRLTGFVAVVFSEITRFLDSIGVRYLTVSRGDMDGRAVHLICITHCVRVQEYAPAVACLTKDTEALLSFFDCPAEHWDHLRTSNPVESVFATARSIRRRKLRNSFARWRGMQSPMTRACRV